MQRVLTDLNVQGIVTLNDLNAFDKAGLFISVAGKETFKFYSIDLPDALLAAQGANALIADNFSPQEFYEAHDETTHEEIPGVTQIMYGFFQNPYVHGHNQISFRSVPMGG